MSSRSSYISEISSVTVHLTIFEGQGLIGKDRNFMGVRTTSDPYVKIYLGGKLKHETKVIFKTLNPCWDEDFKLYAVEGQAQAVLTHPNPLRLAIYDKDDITEDDCMGVVDIPLVMENSGKEGPIEWVDVKKGEKEPDPNDESAEHHYCRNAKGKLKIQVSLEYKTRKSVFE